jgi:hypothetical protein
MGHHSPDIDDFGFVIDLRGNAVIIAANIENHEIPHRVGIWKKFLDRVEVAEFFSFEDIVPQIKSAARAGMSQGEVFQMLPGQYSHLSISAQFVVFSCPFPRNML